MNATKILTAFVFASTTLLIGLTFVGDSLEQANVSTGDISSLQQASTLAQQFQNNTETMNEDSQTNVLTQLETVITNIGVLNSFSRVINFSKISVSAYNNVIDYVAVYVPGIVLIKASFESALFVLFFGLFIYFWRGTG